MLRTKFSRHMALFHWQLTPHQYYHGFWEISILKPKRTHIYTKWCQNPWSITHGNIISSKPMVQAHGISSHFWLMIQAHESHQGNFGSRGLEGQEVCSVKFQWFKVDKEKHVTWHVFPNSQNFDGSVYKR